MQGAFILKNIFLCILNGLPADSEKYACMHSVTISLHAWDYKKLRKMVIIFFFSFVNISDSTK